ncbi:MAG: hypothetical protein N2109_02895 [Fimbriimonadales bacterium]|nr:hypothetical protein [Fimbriimonadales bacterium]
MIGRRPPRRPRVVEHWIYLSHGAPPPLEALVKRFPEGSTERSVLRHPSLHLGLVLRRQNAVPFRPDLGADAPQIEEEALARLGGSTAMLRLVYADRLPPQGLGLAERVALTVQGVARWCPAVAFWDPATEALRVSPPRSESVWDHLRLTETPRGMRILGLQKVGYPDLAWGGSLAEGGAIGRLALRAAAERLAAGQPWAWSLTLDSELGSLSIRIKAGRRGPAIVLAAPGEQR